MSKESLIQELIKDGYLKTPAIIEAFEKIDRKDFVPEDFKEDAYLNQPLAIGFGQTISQPLTVAFMLELLSPQPGDKILEIGAGSGWQTALLSYIISSSSTMGRSSDSRVTALEIIPDLKKMAEENAAKYNFIEKGVAQVILGDGTKGYVEEAPYDKIIAAASALKIPEAWKEQLKINGRIVTPLDHSIIVLDKIHQNHFEKKEYFGFSFVPLVEEEK